MIDDPEPDMPRWSRGEIFTVLSIPALTAAWAVVVMLSGKNVNWTGVEWNFGRTALLGDSFGVVSAVMATAAALFTFLTLQGERNEVRRLRLRERIRDVADREREAETTFFQLLNLRNNLLEGITENKHNGQYNETLTGQQAITYMSRQLWHAQSTSTYHPKDSYRDSWGRYDNQLGHFIRFTYHIIRFVTEKFSNYNKQYEYIRLLRAELSNSEIEIIALNCMYGAGYPKMKKFVEQFALLHNLPDDTISRFDLKKHFAPNAFGE